MSSAGERERKIANMNDDDEDDEQTFLLLLSSNNDTSKEEEEEEEGEISLFLFLVSYFFLISMC